MDLFGGERVQASMHTPGKKTVQGQSYSSAGPHTGRDDNTAEELIMHFKKSTLFLTKLVMVNLAFRLILGTKVTTSYDLCMLRKTVSAPGQKSSDE